MFSFSFDFIQQLLVKTEAKNVEDVIIEVIVF
jgi:hypothetical protein